MSQNFPALACRLQVLEPDQLLADQRVPVGMRVAQPLASLTSQKLSRDAKANRVKDARLPDD